MSKSNVGIWVVLILGLVLVGGLIVQFVTAS
ncbi:hypothetical protein SAMN05444487_101340 [Marininema mesophilum]|uniref:Uncharacterized protein n=1 Tax=Marininema mesophilum TaxID=1048340 RepID=A0A1H2QZZ6_9BACL|nr:hypothetical protein SAMN05444487_101340 [Marininema mesophilum]